jgi:hypothetical protein
MSDRSTIWTYERRDVFGLGEDRQTDFITCGTAYSSAERLAEALVRRVFLNIEGPGGPSVDRVFLYRADGKSVVNMEGGELEEAVKGKPYIGVSRDCSWVVNAIGDGDDLLSMQNHVSRMLRDRKAGSLVSV